MPIKVHENTIHNDLIEPLDARDAKNIPRNKIIYLCTGSQGEPMGAMKRISNNIHPDVFLESGLFGSPS